MIRYTSIVLLLCGISLVANAKTIAPDHPQIEYVGRWHHSDRLAPWCAWQGSSFRFRFRGTGASVELEGGSQDEYLRVIVNGQADPKMVRLAPGRQKLTLLSGRAEGDYEVELVRETYTSRGRMSLLGIEIAGEELLPVEQHSDRLRIAFYGDSNLAGYSVGNERNKAGAEFAGCHYTFAGILARMLRADYQNISSSGATISGQPNAVMTFHDRLDFFQQEPRWDFKQFPADICVVNVGANDINRKTQEQIIRDYVQLLGTLRKAHPQAHIVLMNAYGWSRLEPASYTSDVLARVQDKNLSRLVFPWLFNEWHGCEYDHAGMAVTLARHLGAINPAWKPVNAPDVMDGFSRNGNVANGSFEHAAPFGGFGWRYRDDDGQRVHDPNVAPDGNWYLRLPAGSEVQQPMPTSTNTAHTYRLKMRAASHRAAVTIRFEFRDQQWRNELKDSGREFRFELSDRWQDYEVQVDSPAIRHPQGPSYDPWQIIFRIIASTGTVDVDAISATRKRHPEH